MLTIKQVQQRRRWRRQLSFLQHPSTMRPLPPPRVLHRYPLLPPHPHHRLLHPVTMSPMISMRKRRMICHLLLSLRVMANESVLPLLLRHEHRHRHKPSLTHQPFQSHMPRPLTLPHANANRLRSHQPLHPSVHVSNSRNGEEERARNITRKRKEEDEASAAASTTAHCLATIVLPNQYQ